jgi:hypothetical protein
MTTFHYYEYYQLRCDVFYSSRSQLMFRKNVPPPSSELPLLLHKKQGQYVPPESEKPFKYQEIYHLGYDTTQSVPGGKINTLGGHSIGHYKQKSVHVYMSYSERVPRLSCFIVQLHNY